MNSDCLRRGGPMLAASLALLLSACSSSDDEGDDAGDQTDGTADDGQDDDGQDDGSSACAAPEYGDGTCQPDLDCDAPDIDCFILLDSQAEAEAWFLEFEEVLAAQEFREPRAVVPDYRPALPAHARPARQGGVPTRKPTRSATCRCTARPWSLIEDPSVTRS